MSGSRPVGLRYWNADGRVSDLAPACRAILTEITDEPRGRKHCLPLAGDRAEPQGSVGVQAIVGINRRKNLHREFAWSR
jgi:hypothetical protein